MNREYGIDLLKIVSMFMIVILHILLKGGILSHIYTGTSEWQVAWFLECACMSSVNCFALASGYVGISAQHKYSRIILIWLQTIFYCWTALSISLFYFKINITDSDLLKSIFPITFGAHWYITAYILLAFFMPYLNSIVNNISKSQCIQFIIISLLLFSIWPTFATIDIFKIHNGYSPAWLIILYIVGAIIKKYNLFCSTKFTFIQYIICSILTYLIVFICDKYQIYMFGNIVSNSWIQYTSPFVLIGSLMLFISFKNLKIKSNIGNYITTISKCSLGVFLIHTTPTLWNNYMKDRFIQYTNYDTMNMTFAIFGTAIFIYVSCTLIDYIRIWIFKICKINNIARIVDKKFCK